MLTKVVVAGTASGIVSGLGNIKLCGVLALTDEKLLTLYNGTAATEANKVAECGTDTDHMFMMFPEGREIPCNGLYHTVDNAKGCIIYYLPD